MILASGLPWKTRVSGDSMFASSRHSIVRRTTSAATTADRDTASAAPQYVIIDAKTGAVDANVLGVGAGDEVWFNKGDGHYYTASSGSPLAPNAITPARPPWGRPQR